MNIFNKDIGQATSFDNLSLQPTDKNLSFQEFLKDVVLKYEKSKQEGVNNTLFEGLETPSKNTEMFSELFLQLLSHVLFNNPNNLKPLDGLYRIMQSGEVDLSEKNVILVKKITVFLLKIAKMILNNIQEKQETCGDQKNPTETLSDKDVENEILKINLSAPSSIPVISNPMNLDNEGKEENMETPHNIEYVLFNSQLNLTVDQKNPTEAQSDKDIKNKTVEVNFSIPTSIMGILNPMNLHNEGKEENMEKPHNIEYVLFHNKIDITDKYEETVEDNTFTKILTDHISEDLSTNKGMIYNEKEYDIKPVEMKTFLMPEEKGVKISVKNFAVEHKSETKNIIYEVIIKTTETDKLNEDMDKKDFEQVRFTTEMLNVQDGNIYKAPHAKQNEISMRPDLVLVEKIEKITEHFLQDKKIADMIIKFKIDEKDIIHIALKREGASISVNVKTTSLEVVNLLNAQKEAIIKGLEDKNITTSISIYPDGKNGKEKGQYSEDGRRQYRKRNNKDEFYEVLMTQKV
ncbi:MAG: hypothetical protein N2596_02580 [Syntrophorhabdaceae bacterium]|nr:hypothetical protein [Syntrophorhabdaceae bacterium]